MQKIEVAALATDRDLVLSLLSKEGTVEIVPVVVDAASRNAADDALLKQTTQLRQRIADALKRLDLRFPEEKSMFTVRSKIDRAEYEAVLAQENELAAALDRFERGLAVENEMKSAIAQLNTQQSWLQGWLGLPVDLSVTETEKTAIIYAVANDARLRQEATEALAEEAPETVMLTLKEDGKRQLLAVIARRRDAARVRARLTAADIQPLPLAGQQGTPDLLQERFTAEKTALEQSLAENVAVLQDLTKERRRLKILYDALGERELKLLASAQLGRTGRTVYFSGWIPAKKAARMQRRLIEQAHAAVTLRDPLEGEEFPVLLENNKFNQAFESILTMFGAPVNTEVDPMPAMAPFYMLIFGMMLSDVGYGLLLTLGAAYMLFVVKVEDSLRGMSRMLLISGFASIAWGFLFGGFFGDLVTVLSRGRVSFPVLWFDPMKAPMNLLIFSMLFGIIHLFVGMAVKIINAHRFGSIWDGLWDTVPWYLIITGVVLLLAGATGVAGEGTVFANILSATGKWMALGGAVLVIADGIRKKKNPITGFFSGLLSLYNITAWLSDILSYSRILALVLATSVIAVVFNSISAMTLGLPTPLNYLVFALIAVPTHLLNLSLSALSAYVHASRLQYIEMFGKFFDGGGRYYKPLKNQTKYINVLDTPSGEMSDDDA